MYKARLRDMLKISINKEILISIIFQSRLDTKIRFKMQDNL